MENTHQIPKSGNNFETMQCQILAHLSRKIFLKSSNYTLVPFGRLIQIFVIVYLLADTAGQAGPKFKTVCHERIIRDILRRSG